MCFRLNALNLAWCALDSESMGYLCQSLPSSITRLNIAGCRKTLTDDSKFYQEIKKKYIPMQTNKSN